MNADQLAKSLTQQHGPFIKGKELMTYLGFSSPGSFARARKRGLLEVKVFDLEGRRGPFALTEEVAEWVAGFATRKPAETSRDSTHATSGGAMT